MGKARTPRPPELAGFSEQALARLWRARAARAGMLRAQHGGRLQVLYPGRPSSSAGPDFRDALLYVEGVGLTRGDVELHLKQSDWRAHGHHHDHRYNSVALHVVYSTEDAPTYLANGAETPVLSAKGLLDLPDGPSVGVGGASSRYLWRLLEMCGYPQPSTPEEMGALLDRAGDARFEGKVDDFRRQISEDGAEQALYAAIMEGLGYSQNRAPFIELAYRAPIAWLRERASAVPETQKGMALEGWLLDAAGFGPEGSVQALQQNGDPSNGVGGLRWNLFRVRPVNHPKQRIKGAAWLIARHLEGGLVQGMERCVEGGVQALQFGLQARQGAEDGGKGDRALIGADRARELAINAVLPFAAAWGRVRPAPALAEAAVALYHKHPRATINEIHREMAELLIPTQWRCLTAAVGNGARRQQGLLHLHRLLCRSDFRGDAARRA